MEQIEYYGKFKPRERKKAKGEKVDLEEKKVVDAGEKEVEAPEIVAVAPSPEKKVEAPEIAREAPTPTIPPTIPETQPNVHNGKLFDRGMRVLDRSYDCKIYDGVVNRIIQEFPSLEAFAEEGIQDQIADIIRIWYPSATKGRGLGIDTARAYAAQYRKYIIINKLYEIRITSGSINLEPKAPAKLPVSIETLQEIWNRLHHEFIYRDVKNEVQNVTGTYHTKTFINQIINVFLTSLDFKCTEYSPGWFRKEK